MIGAASPVCQRGMDGTEPAWTTNFACCVTWPPVAKPGTGIYRDVHTCGEVDLRRGAGVTTRPFPQVPSRTRRAPFSAPGAPRVLPAGQPLVAAAGSGVHGVGMLLPR